MRRRRATARPGRLAALGAGFVASALVLGAGCGYRLAAQSPLVAIAAGRPVQPVAFENLSTEPDAGLVAARAATRALGRLGGGGSGAPLELGGVVESVSIVAAHPTRRQTVELWRAEGRVRVRLRDPSRTGSPAVAEAVASGVEEYRPGFDSIEATEVSRELALERLLSRLVEDAVGRLAPVK